MADSFKQRVIELAQVGTSGAAHELLAAAYTAYAGEEDCGTDWSINGHELDELNNEVIGDVRVSVVDEVGGGEGEGEYVHRVYSFSSFDNTVLTYVKITGFYESYNGTSWDDADPTFVFPKEVMHIEYFSAVELAKREGK